MNEISTRESPPARSVETVTLEIRTLQHQAQQMLLSYAIEIGRRLVEVKALLPHGQWGDYIKEQVGYSQSTANNLMRVFEEYGAPQQSMFGAGANSQALGNLSYTKALRLLAIPADEREAFAEEHHVEELSTRQLEQAIKERDEARAAAQRAEADKHTAEQAQAKMAEDMGMLNASLASAQDAREQAMQDVARLEAELADLKAKPVDVAVETVVDQAAIEKARAEAVAEMQAKLDKAREKQKKAEAQRQEAQEQLETAQRKLEEQAKAEKRENLAGDKEWAQFELLFNQAKDHANQMLELLFHARGRKDQATAQIMEKALMALSEQIGRCAK